MGNPNVGKSVLFSRLTGLGVIASNYPGTTVSYTRGSMQLNGTTVEVVDVPGSYTLDPTSEAENVALQMLETGDIIVNVVDATNLERNLYLTVQLLERKIPMVVALNMWDDTTHQGITIDMDRLRMRLKVPVVPTVAVTGEGVKQLVELLHTAAITDIPVRNQDERWITIGSIINEVQRLVHHHHTWRNRLADASVQPVTGGILAMAILCGSFFLVRFLGESLIDYLVNPVFNTLWAPILEKFSSFLGGAGLLHNLLIGKLIDGQVDFVQSFGLLSSGLYVPFGMVLPYIISFYLALGILEDSGYLPRLAILMDTVMHHLGLHGYAIIPTLLGLGCNVPGVLATRILESRRERFIAATLISIAIPCAALQAMILGILGKHGIQYVAIVYGTLFAAWLITGFILRHMVKGFAPELLIEIPPYRLPIWQAVLRKLRMRVSGFLIEAVPIIMVTVLVINIVHYLGILDNIARLTSPVVTGLWGLPKEAATAIIVGFMRKDMAVGLLMPLALSVEQATVACVVLAMFFPCVATFAVLFKELGFRDTVKATGIMFLAASTIGGILRLILSL
ncbi:MAG: ferrous iron transporter B [Lentisphaerae bacterium RIFOXYA12_FULL_48_11]|nr:MAG: ferrous iron transporter B [Lentisphaerae bacterium RIFOXYA12_FULL_48_11]